MQARTPKMFRRASLLLASAAAVPPWSAWDTCAKTYARSVAAIFPRHTTDDILAKLPPPTTNHPHASDRSPLVLLARADIDVQQALEESEFKPPRSLHRLARDALDEIITAGVNGDIDRNLEHCFSMA